MAKQLRKKLEEVLSDVPEINQKHVDDFHFCKSAFPFLELERDILKHPGIFQMRGFSLKAAQTAPKTIRYRQRDSDWELGKKGDYMLVDNSGGKLCVPFQIFKRLFL
jgi:hypothetical protein